jgi:hypothetical protein
MVLYIISFLGFVRESLLKKSTKQHADGWDTSSKAWTHMVLHLLHVDDGFGVQSNDITKDTAFYTTTSRFVACLGAFSQERQSLWLPKDDLKDSSTWSSPPLVLLRDIHDGLLAKYDCKDNVSPPAQPGVRARPPLDSQNGLDGESQQEAAPLFLPKLNQFHELSIVRGEVACSRDRNDYPSMNFFCYQIVLQRFYHTTRILFLQHKETLPPFTHAPRKLPLWRGVLPGGVRPT